VAIVELLIGLISILGNRTRRGREMWGELVGGAMRTHVILKFPVLTWARSVVPPNNYSVISKTTDHGSL